MRKNLIIDQESLWALTAPRVMEIPLMELVHVTAAPTDVGLQLIRYALNTNDLAELKLHQEQMSSTAIACDSSNREVLFL